jgi:hypothetical protein
VQWFAGWVDDCWWDEVDVAGVDEDFPAGVVHVAVVGLAEENTVLEAGGTAVGPVLTVMRLAQSRWPVATGESASAVSRDERAANG